MRRARYLPAVLALAVALGAAPVVSWREAGEHVGEFVTVEGDVVDATTTGDTCVLEFTRDDPQAFRALLLLPLITDLPRYPDRLYRGKRIRASGLVRRYKGRLEMVLRNPGQIEVVDVAGAPTVAAAPAPAAPPATPPAAAAPPPAAAPPTQTPVAATPTMAETPPPAPTAEAPPPPRGLAEAVGRQLALADPCERAHARWRDAARSADELAGALSRCLRQGGYRCRTAGAALAPAVSTLEWAEQQVEDACP